MNKYSSLIPFGIGTTGNLGNTKASRRSKVAVYGKFPCEGAPRGGGLIHAGGRSRQGA